MKDWTELIKNYTMDAFLSILRISRSLFSRRLVPKIDPHFMTFLVGVKESSIIFFLLIIKLIEWDSG